MNNSTLITIIILFLLFQLSLGGGGLFANFTSNPAQTLMFLCALVIALTIHEFAHALTADKLGDPNPRIAGRVSLNPLKHLDPIGTLLIIFAGFGWGKPVSFDPYNLKDSVKDGAWIAAAGPLSNIVLACVCAGLIRLLPFAPLSFLLTEVGSYLTLFLLVLFNTNLSLALFNLLPFYPLDGHHIVRVFLKTRQRASYDIFNRHFGMIIALIILFVPFGGQTVVSYILTPTLNFSRNLLLGI
jgi:Zn-dependent protease